VAGFGTGCLHDGEGVDGDDEGNESDGEEKVEEETEDDEGNGTEGEPERPSARFVGTEFEVLEERSGTRGDEVSVEFNDEDEAVVVEGTTFGRNSCYTATLESVEYDEEEGVLRLNVGTFDDSEEDEFCIGVITEIEYRVVANFEEGLPRRVVVEHDGDRVTEARGDIGNIEDGDTGGGS